MGERERAVGAGEGGQRLGRIVDRGFERGSGVLEPDGDDGGSQGGLVRQVLVEGGGADPEPCGEPAHRQRLDDVLLQQLRATATIWRARGVSGSATLEALPGAQPKAQAAVQGHVASQASPPGYQRGRAGGPHPTSGRQRAAPEAMDGAGDDRVLSDADVELLTATARVRLRPASSRTYS